MSLPQISGTARIISDVAVRDTKSGGKWVSCMLLFQAMRQGDDGRWTPATSSCAAWSRSGSSPRTSQTAWPGATPSRSPANLKHSKWTDASGTEQVRVELVVEDASASMKWNRVTVQREPRGQQRRQQQPTDLASRRQQVGDRLRHVHQTGPTTR